MHTVTPAVLPEVLHPFWRHWNLGRFYRSKRIGGARLVQWRITADEAQREFLRAKFNPKRAGRWTPPGDYVKLELSQGIFDDEERWTLVMSDAPDELADHIDVLMRATGRVLIHGLGLGCVLHCLLHKADVTHVDVVEVDADVIALVGPYMHRVAAREGKSLMIHHASCVDPLWAPGTHWNYVWHDIWSAIDADNLTDDELAEHGISYARLHRMFAHRCDHQASWALREARWQREVHRLTDRLAAEFIDEWQRSNRRARLLLLARILTPEIPPEQYVAFIRVTTPDMYEAWLKLARRRKPFPPEDARGLLADTARHRVFKRKPKADERRAQSYAATQVCS